MKELIRVLMYPVAVCCGGDLYAVKGTLLCKFMTWLYGEGEPEIDPWTYPPDDPEDKRNEP